MTKSIFSIEEARRIAWPTPPHILKLQLYQWAERGELVRLKRGLYAFPEKEFDKTEIVRNLYPPSYISLEYALHSYGLLPDVVFSVTLVTPRITKRFKTPYGEFLYHHIQPGLFWGYDPTTVMGEREKVLLDYLYLYSGRLLPRFDFWETLRWQNLKEFDFKKARRYAKRFPFQKVRELLDSLELYQKGG